MTASLDKSQIQAEKPRRTPQPLRRWFRFRLRTLLIALTVGCIWLGHQVNWIRERRAALDWVVEHGWYRRFDNYEGDLVQPPVSLRCFGEQGVSQIGIYPTFVESDASIDHVKRLRRLFPEAKCIIHYPPDGNYTDWEWPEGDFTSFYLQGR